MGTGKLIVFEGGEGAGKSTQIRLIADSLRQRGYDVVETREPGGTELGIQLRHLVMTAEGRPPAPLAELLLYIADRAQHVAELIAPALRSGRVVLCDRFSASTLAYQGFGRGLELAMVKDLDGVARAGIRPDLTILLDCPVAIGLQRARGSDRFHLEDRQFHERIRAAFLSFAKDEASSYCLIDATQPKEEVFHQGLAGVLKCLNRS